MRQTEVDNPQKGPPFRSSDKLLNSIRNVTLTLLFKHSWWVRKTHVHTQMHTHAHTEEMKRESEREEKEVKRIKRAFLSTLYTVEGLC